MEELKAYRVDLLAALEGVIDVLAKTVADLPASKWIQPIHPVGHTPHYILFHLRALELQVFAIELPRFLVEDTPTLPAFDDESWMAQHYSAEEPPSTILEQLKQVRHQELTWLRNLSPAGWSHLGRHPWWGLHSLQWWVELQVDYSYQHLKQLSVLHDT
ncbi:MAG TPA: DinB family protein [Anaerolineales bacterium]|nr:DinB family protein [Anaerolineales bacterium]